jgi:hypothetical protein
VWLIVGTERVGVIGLCPETAGVTLLDFVAKVGLGIVLLSSRDVFDDAGTGAGTTGQATVDWTGWNADRVSVDRLFDPTEQPRPWRSNGTRRSGRMLKIFTESNRNKDYPRGTAPIHGDTGCGCQAVSRVGRSMQTIIKYEYLDTSSATGEWKTEPVQHRVIHEIKMNLPNIVFGLHVSVGVLIFGVGVYAAINGSVIQLFILGSIAVMIGLLGRSVSRLLARQ